MPDQDDDATRILQAARALKNLRNPEQIFVDNESQLRTNVSEAATKLHAAQSHEDEDKFGDEIVEYHTELRQLRESHKSTQDQKNKEYQYQRQSKIETLGDSIKHAFDMGTVEELCKHLATSITEDNREETPADDRDSESQGELHTESSEASINLSDQKTSVCRPTSQKIRRLTFKAQTSIRHRP